MEKRILRLHRVGTGMLNLGIGTGTGTVQRVLMEQPRKEATLGYGPTCGIGDEP